MKWPDSYKPATIFGWWGLRVTVIKLTVCRHPGRPWRYAKKHWDWCLITITIKLLLLHYEFPELIRIFFPGPSLSYYSYPALKTFSAGIGQVTKQWKFCHWLNVDVCDFNHGISQIAWDFMSLYITIKRFLNSQYEYCIIKVSWWWSRLPHS